MKTIRLFKCYYGLIGYRLLRQKRTRTMWKICSWIKSYASTTHRFYAPTANFCKAFSLNNKGGNTGSCWQTQAIRYYIRCIESQHSKAPQSSHDERVYHSYFPLRETRRSLIFEPVVFFFLNWNSVCGFIFLSEEICNCKVFGKNN